MFPRLSNATAAYTAALAMATVIAVLAGPPMQRLVGPVDLEVSTISFSQKTVHLEPPSCTRASGVNSSPAEVYYAGVRFVLELDNWCSPAGGQLKGLATETSGTSFDFVLAGTPGSSMAATWYSPDRQFGVSWDRGLNVQLLVEDHPGA